MDDDDDDSEDDQAVKMAELMREMKIDDKDEKEEDAN